MKKSTQIFEFDERKRERYIFFECMKFLDQNNECMQECYECQDEHQEHYECHDEHQDTILKNF